MEAIKVFIEKMGLISQSELHISPMMIFSGESGLGKSYAAILSHYFFSVWLNPKRLNAFFSGRGVDFVNVPANMPDSGIALVVSRTELEDWLAKDAIAYLGYMIGYEDFRAQIRVELPAQKIPDIIEFKYDQELEGLNNAEDIYYRLGVLGLTYRFRQLGIQDESPYAYLMRFAMIDALFGDFKSLGNAFVLPPSRGSYLSEKLVAQTGLYQSFEQGMIDLNNAKEIQDVVSEDVVRLFEEVVNGEVKREGDRYMYYAQGMVVPIPISAAASSVKEIAPLQISIHKRDISKLVMLVEEPEAHLHPLKQSLMADVLAIMAMGNTRMQITTHSDYFLRRLNDLMRLHILRDRYGEEQYHAFCKEHGFVSSHTLDPSIVAAYFLKRRDDGSVEIVHQDIRSGIPFDTFAEINGKPMANSAMLYELTMNVR